MLVESGVKGTRITATSIAAEKAGAAIGQMLNDARAGCPEIYVEQAAANLDQIFLQRLGHWAMRYSPVVALDGDDGLLIDTYGCDHLFGGEEGLMRDALARFARIGLTARAAIADTKGAAWALARFGLNMEIMHHTACLSEEESRSAFIIAPPGEAVITTAALPVDGLRLDDNVLLLLRRLGLKQISALRAIPRSALERRFHSRQAAWSVRLRLDQMAGEISEPLTPLKEVAPCRETLGLAEPAIDEMAIAMALDHLLQRIKTRLERDGLGVRALTLAACHSDGGHDALTIRLGRASRDPDHIARLFKDRLAEIDPGYGIDMFILAADRVEPIAEEQKSLTAHSQGEGGDIVLLIDKLMNRLGAAHITRLVPVASHLPEQAQRIVLAGMAEPAAAWHGPVPTARPFRLFERPEEIETLAEVPDGPPLRFTWRRLTRKIIRARGPERIAPQWWREIEDANGRELFFRTNARDYYEVEDEEGLRYWLFRAGLYGETRHGAAPQWFIHGLFG